MTELINKSTSLQLLSSPDPPLLDGESFGDSGDIFFEDHQRSTGSSDFISRSSDRSTD